MEVGSLDFELKHILDFVVPAFVADVDTYYIGHVDKVDFDYQLVDIDWDYQLVDIDFVVVDIDFVVVDIDFVVVDIGYVVDIEKILVVLVLHLDWNTF